jgi:hypothetical protein
LKESPNVTNNYGNQDKYKSPSKKNMLPSTKNKFGFIFIFILLLNANEIHARYFDRGIRNAIYSSSKNTDPSRLSIFVIYAGAAAGGKQNTSYFLKSRITIAGKANLDGSTFFLLNGDKLYNANFSWGNSIAFSMGVEWGNRTFFINKDSTLEKLKFKNLATGQYANYSSLTGATFPEELTTYAMGISFNPKKAAINYWRGKGRCWSLYNIKFEGLYAPFVSYSKIFNVVTEGPYEESTESYLIENSTVQHWGFRLVIDTRLSSKIGMMMEAGTRPGVKSEVNSEGRFSNAYLRIGVEIGFVVGGRKPLNDAELDEDELRRQRQQ